MRRYRGIYGQLVSSEVQSLGMELTYLSDIFVGFIASPSQPGESEDCAASKDTLAVGLNTLLHIIF
jgi:hypothetical protein